MTAAVLAACTPRPDASEIGPRERPAETRAPPAPPDPVVPAGPGRIRVELDFEERAQRRVRVQVSFPTDGRSSMDLAMPVWIPGSYLVREFARHVVDLTAVDAAGRARPVTKVTKNRWVVRSEGTDAVTVRYTLLAHELSVRTNFVGPDYGVLNPGAAVLFDPERPERAYELVFHLPEAWPRAAGALAPLAEAETASVAGEAFFAPSYDALVDAPFLLGDLDVRPFTVDGIGHRLVSVGRLDRFPLPRAARDVESIVRAQVDFWGELPYRRYDFLSVLDEAGGGLEHRSSTLIMTPPERALTPKGHRRWLGLVSHELFHAWNGKRLRPRVLGPFDLEREAYTRSLWWVEGLTSYYDDLLLRRAGLLDDDAYLDAVSSTIRRLYGSPGERHASLAEASFDAWIELYRPDEESGNTGVNYYVKGALAGWVLDAAIRRASRDRRSLDDVMRRAYARFSGETGYDDAALYDLFEAVGGSEVRALAERLTQRAEPIDLSGALSAFGLRRVEPSPNTPAGRAELAARTELGVETQACGGRTVVTSVREGGPAWSAGLTASDEVVFLADDRVPSDGLKPLLRRHLPGDRVSVVVSRRGRRRRFEVVLGEARPAPRIEIDPSAPPDARRRRARWLRGD